MASGGVNQGVQTAAVDEHGEVVSCGFAEFFTHFRIANRPHHASSPRVKHQGQAVGDGLHALDGWFCVGHLFFENMKSSNIIVHKKRDVPFTMVWNEIWEAPISWKAKGILGYIIGKPEGWKVRVADLVTRSHGMDGETSVRSALKELRAAGYAVLEFLTEGNILNGSVLKVSDSPVFFDRPENICLRAKISRDSENPKLGKPETRETRVPGNRNHSNTELLDRRNSYKEAAVSASRGEASPPPLLPRVRADIIEPTSSVKNAPDGAEEEEPFELDEKGEALKKLWDDHYPVIFKRSPVHTEDDLIAFNQLASESSLREMMGFILSAWSMKKKDQGFDPYFYCARYSSRPRDFVIAVCKDKIRNLDKMRDEMSWRGAKNQVQFGYDWFEKMKKQSSVVTT